MPKRHLSVLLTAVMLAALSQAAHAALAPGVIGLIKDAVVLIEVRLEASASGTTSEVSGSGFAISPNGEIVTNAHVVAPEIEEDDGRTIAADKVVVKVVFYPNTPREESHTATVERQNAQIDLAVLKIARPTPRYLELADSDKVEETEAIFVCGHPLGLREISIRGGAVTAKRIWEGKHYIEHDAAAESGNSGGPVVDESGRVVGVHTLTIAAASSLTKFAIPSNVLRDWLRAAPSSDPKRETPGVGLKELLIGADLAFSDHGDGVFMLPYKNGVSLYVHAYDDFVRGFVPLGELPGTDDEGRGEFAKAALLLNYSDPIGRMSVQEQNGKYNLYWEFQAPRSAMTPKLLRYVGQVGTQQAAFWKRLLSEDSPKGPAWDKLNDEVPGAFGQLGTILKGSGLKYETDSAREVYELPYQGDNALTVRVSVVNGMAWTHLYLGGIPGADKAGKGQVAIKLLKRNWADPFGRISMDRDDDVLWESQVPIGFLTSDYLAVLSNTCAGQAASFWGEYGHVPLNGG